MNGPQHYRAAEFRIKAAKGAESDEIEQIQLAYAQVHATLALAAATFESTTNRNSDAGLAWQEVFD